MPEYYDLSTSDFPPVHEKTSPQKYILTYLLTSLSLAFYLYYQNMLKGKGKRRVRAYFKFYLLDLPHSPLITVL